MAELREQHLGIPRPKGSESVFDRLHAAYEAELAKVRLRVGGAGLLLGQVVPANGPFSFSQVQCLFPWSGRIR